jgi:hypothetical protein
VPPNVSGLPGEPSKLTTRGPAPYRYGVAVTVMSVEVDVALVSVEVDVALVSVAAEVALVSVAAELGSGTVVVVPPGAAAPQAASASTHMSASAMSVNDRTFT